MIQHVKQHGKCKKEDVYLLVVRQHVHHARRAEAKALAAKAMGPKPCGRPVAMLLHEGRHCHLLLLVLLLR